MRNAVPSPQRPRYRRLLVLCACSAALHLALLAWIATRADRPAAAALAPHPPDLNVRLLPAGARNPAPPVPAAAHAPVRPAAAPAASRQPVPARAGAGRSMRSPAPPVRASTPDAAPSHDLAPALAAPGAPLLPMPGRYRVRTPAPALLTYAVVRQAPGGAPQAGAPARLDWRAGQGRYVLEMDGVLGRLRSEGVNGDTGIVPRSARAERDGAETVTVFDAQQHRVRFDDGSDVPQAVGMQDPASLLIQLAGIGLADPAQFGNGVRVVVAGAREARIAAFRMLGEEDVETGAGTLATWHLARRGAPGDAALDVWLAPAHDWLPVRIRVVEAGGASITQTLRAIAPAPGLDADASADADADAPP